MWFLAVPGFVWLGWEVRDLNCDDGEMTSLNRDGWENAGAARRSR